MAPGRGSRSSFSDQHGTELQARSTPRIAVTDLEPSTGSSDSSSTPPAPSPSSSTSPGSLHTPPSPISSVDPADVADCAVQNAQRVAESLDGDTLQPSIATTRSMSSPSPPPAPSPIDTGSGSDAASPARTSVWHGLLSAESAKKVLSLSVIILTIVTVVYSHRSFVLEKWNNVAAWWDYCKDPSNQSERCKYPQNHDLPPPPYTPDEWIGGSGGSANPLSDFIKFFPPIMASALGAGIIGFVVWFVVHRRRRGQATQSDQSMVRRHFSAPDIGHGEQAQRRVRAFVTMEQAINGIKSAKDGEATSMRPSGTRRFSNPYSRHNPWLTASDPSIFDSAEFYEYDPETEKQKEKWRRITTKAASVSTLASCASLSSDKLQKVSPSSPPEPTFKQVPEGEVEAHGWKKKLERWATPPRITIIKSGEPELEEGDFKGGAAFIGAVIAATVGGGAMKKCPIELPIEAGRLGIGMHISPQDDLGLLHS